MLGWTVFFKKELREMRRLVLQCHSIVIPIYLKRDVQQAALCVLCAWGLSIDTKPSCAILSPRMLQAVWLFS